MRPHPRVSPPLPLSVGFALLPSRLPGQQLTPLLYSVINGLPVYLTVSPSHAPHVSFLPIILALRIAYTPLSLLVEYGLTPNQYSLDVDGVAPWADLWVPLDTARKIIRDIGASRLFWDDRGRGLLGKVGDAVSWEEGGGWYHNWLPSKSHLPASSYSLDTLLSRTFSFIETIPDDRCVFTPVDGQRIARLRSEAMSNDHSRVRTGAWGPAWDALLGWTVQSWSEYRLTPSKLSVPPNPKKRRRPTSIIDLLNSVPSLFGNPTPSPIPLDPSDLARLAPSLRSPTTIAHTTYQVLLAIYRTSASVVPGLGKLTPISLQSDTDLILSAWRVRLQLALCSLLSETVVGIWRIRRENDRLRAALASKGDQLPPDILLSPGSPKPDYRRPPSRPSSSTSSEELDVLVDLERRRGGSPPPPGKAKRKRRPPRASRHHGPPKERSSLGTTSKKPIRTSTASETSDRSSVGSQKARSSRRSTKLPIDHNARPEARWAQSSDPTQTPLTTPSARSPHGDAETTMEKASPTLPPNIMDELEERSHQKVCSEAEGALDQQQSDHCSGLSGDAHHDSESKHAGDDPSLAVSEADGASEQGNSTASDAETNESIAGSVVQSIERKGRIQPILTVTLSLIAVAAAYFVLFLGGPSSSVYG